MGPNCFLQPSTKNTTEVVYGERTAPSVTSTSAGESEAADSWNFLAMQDTAGKVVIKETGRHSLTV